MVISAFELPLAVWTWIRASPSHRSIRLLTRWMSWMRVYVRWTSRRKRIPQRIEIPSSSNRCMSGSR
jgi:hypothetical protein